MLLEFKKIFNKETSLGRFEYIKLALGLLLFPALAIQLAIIISPNNLLFYPAATSIMLNIVFIFGGI